MKTKHKRGLTLLEVMVSIAILTISFAAMAMAFSMGLMAIRATRETSIAMQAAQEEVENMRNTPFGGVDTHSFNVASLDTTGTVVVEVEDADLKKVSVNVPWTSGASRNMSINLLTRITRNGIDRQ